MTWSGRERECVAVDALILGIPREGKGLRLDRLLRR
jgi:hypothetical protein